MRALRRIVLAIVAAGALLAIDVGSKAWAVRELRGQGIRSLAGGHLLLTYTENRGIAFGLGRKASAEVREPLLAGYSVAVALGVALVLARLLLRDGPVGRAAPTGLTVLLAGTMGNLHDRLERGYVVDFLDVSGRGRIEWPTFNVADVYIAVGLVLCLWALLRPALRGAPGVRAIAL